MLWPALAIDDRVQPLLTQFGAHGYRRDAVNNDERQLELRKSAADLLLVERAIDWRLED